MTPQSAARKAAKQIFDKSPADVTVVTLRLVEQTQRGSRGKTFTYIAEKIDVDEVRILGGKEIHIMKKIVVHAADESSLA